MGAKILLLIMAAALVGAGCTNSMSRHTEELVYQDGKLQKFSYVDDSTGAKGDSAPFMEAVDILRQADPMAIPELQDLPMPGVPKKDARKYTGIIKNKTRFDIQVPSLNSDATLDIPAHSWIEYTAWQKHFEVTAYRNGKPYYCLKVAASPREYPFMCKKYDFIAEVVKAEPKSTPVGSKLKKRIKRKKPCPPEAVG